MSRARRLALTLLVALAGSGTAQRPYPVPIDYGSRSKWLHHPQREAAAVLQGSNGRRSAVLDSSLIEEVATALAAIRTTVPDLTDAISARGAAMIELDLNPLIGRRLRARGRRISGGESPRLWKLVPRKDGSLTGIPRLDSISRANGVDGATLFALDEGNPRDPRFILVIGFRQFVNVPQLIPAYSHVSGIEAAHEADPPDETYVVTTVEPRDLSAAEWRFHFHEGRGDCPAGCTAAVKSQVAYARNTRTARVIRRDTIGAPLASAPHRDLPRR